MDIWKYIEILKKKKSFWVSTKDNINERLTALSHILEYGYPSIIPNIFFLLKDDNKLIQNAACNTIIDLFNKVQSKKDYYESLKYCNISISDIELFETIYSKNQFLYILLIASLNSNGYVRENAVKRLSNSNEIIAIRFIIYRLADWVKPIQNAALLGLEQFKKIEFINALVDNLLVFDWLQKVQRTDLSIVYNDIIDFIIKKNKAYTYKNFEKFTDRNRHLIARHLVKSAEFSSREINLLIQDKYFLCRGLLIEHFEKLNQIEIQKLLNDKSTSNRLKILQKLKNQENFTEIILKLVADNSASIREFSRFYLKMDSTVIAKIYYENLIQNNHIIGSIAGLAEINCHEYSNIVISFLQNGTPKIVKTTFLYLAKLEKDIAFNFALQNIEHENNSIRNVIIEFLSHNASPEVIDKARIIYKNSNIQNKKSILKLFSKIGGWIVLSDIILGTIDNDETIRNLSYDYLQIWRRQAVNLFTKPNPDDIQRTKKIFNFVFEIHEEKQYFQVNPLEEIKFYVK